MSRRDDVARVVREVLAPLVAADGGKLWLVQLDDRDVALHLAGRFSGCPGNQLVLERILRPAIEAAAPDARVRLTSGPLVPAGAVAVGDP